MMLLLAVLTLLGLTLIYFKVTRINKYWDERGVAYVRPLPIFGNMMSTFFQRRSLVELLNIMYHAHPKERYVGAFQFGTPVLIIRDLELIKRLTVKEFDAFPNHIGFVASPDDLITSKNLFNLKAENGWHDMRATLSPAFTGSKMRAMFVLMEECANQFVDYFKGRNDNIISVELKDTFSRFTNDVIATTAFGVTCNSLADKNNEFYILGKRLSNFKGVQFLKFIANLFIPKLLAYMKIKFFNTEASNYFTRIIKENLKIREEQSIVRPDMIYLMMEAKNGRLKDESQCDVSDSEFAATQVVHELGKSRRFRMKLTDDDIIAQAILFFIAGFDPISTNMLYICYELARHPEIQQRLFAEIEDVCKEKLVYETVLGMRYLDCVVSEILRKWPPAAFLDRVSVKPITIEPERPHEKTLHLDAGQVIWIPMSAIHKDSKYYPDPDKFDPERFNDENRKNIHPYSYIPFGSGPRNCIGNRFALLETKLMTVKLLQNFEIVPVKETPEHIKYSTSNLNPLPDDDIRVGFRQRNV